MYAHSKSFGLTEDSVVINIPAYGSISVDEAEELVYNIQREIKAIGIIDNMLAEKNSNQI